MDINILIDLICFILPVIIAICLYLIFKKFFFKTLTIDRKFGLICLAITLYFGFFSILFSYKEQVKYIVVYTYEQAKGIVVYTYEKVSLKVNYEEIIFSRDNNIKIIAKTFTKMDKLEIEIYEKGQSLGLYSMETKNNKEWSHNTYLSNYGVIRSLFKESGKYTIIITTYGENGKVSVNKELKYPFDFNNINQLYFNILFCVVCFYFMFCEIINGIKSNFKKNL